MLSFGVNLLKVLFLLSSLFSGGFCLADYASHPFTRFRKAGEVPQFLPEIGLSVRRNPLDAELLSLTSQPSSLGRRLEDQGGPLDSGLLKVSSKRSTLLLDKILFALQRAVNDKKLGPGGSLDGSESEGLKKASQLLREELLSRKASNAAVAGGERVLRVSEPINFSAYTGNGLQRRGTTNGKVYWRCYFNAVSCF